MNWSRNMVPNYSGANAILGSAATSRQVVTISSPVTIGRLTLENAFGYTLAGGSSITLQTPARTARVDVLLGNHAIDVPINVASDAQFNVSGGWTLTTAGITAATAGLEIAKTGPGTLAVEHVRGGGPLSIAGGTLQVRPAATNNSANGASTIGGLTIAAGGSLDLTNNTLVIDYDGVSPINDFRQLLRGGDIRSSVATAATRIGYAEGSDTSVVLAYTQAGDANLDFTVNINDFAALAANFNLPGVWAAGDFDYDAVTGIADFSLLAANFNNALAAEGARSAVPEPAVAFTGISLVALMTRRRSLVLQ
jgi:hypothetical protein